ncbi:MAG TPA: MlaE family lipid ABC transporter permease subunit [Polyangia bacterium]|jgi:phospholipid/cholesterol/gamma-HCH transport system permease protein
MPAAVPSRLTAARAADPAPAFRIDVREPAAGVVEVLFAGTLAFAQASSFWAELRARLPPTTREEVRFDLSAIESIDGGAMALLVQAKWDLQTAGVRCQFVGGRGTVQTILELYEGEAAATPRPPHEPVGALAQIGNGTVTIVKELQLALAFLGNMVLALAGVLRDPRTGNFHDVAPIMNRSGADAVPIVVLINFLIGFALAFQAAVQLKAFGANIYVADLVGLSITRELGPLMTAIIVCGRSGAAFAAELGTMRVSEEVDALRTMGIGPLRFLVFPRMLALFLVMPVLTLLADLCGIAGGLLVGVVNLDLTLVGYLNQTGRALKMWDVFQGLIKSGVFGLAIGLISCHQGLATTGGAEGVGRRTTAAVVAALIALIVIDAAFTLLFFELRL